MQTFEILDKFRKKRIQEAEARITFPLGLQARHSVFMDMLKDPEQFEAKLKLFMDFIMTWPMRSFTDCGWCKNQSPRTDTCCLNWEISHSPLQHAEEAAVMLHVVQQPLVTEMYWKGMCRYYRTAGWHKLGDALSLNASDETFLEEAHRVWTERRQVKWLPAIDKPHEVMRRVCGTTALERMPQCFGRISLVPEYKWRMLCVKMMKRAGVCYGGCLFYLLQVEDPPAVLFGERWREFDRLVFQAFESQADFSCAEVQRCDLCPFGSDGLLCRRDAERFPKVKESPKFERVGISPLVFVEVCHE